MISLVIFIGGAMIYTSNPGMVKGLKPYLKKTRQYLKSKLDDN